MYDQRYNVPICDFVTESPYDTLLTITPSFWGSYPILCDSYPILSDSYPIL